jgi:dTDP-6-deoxy-L-talose 4-dehydrogenase (NAD+)
MTQRVLITGAAGFVGRQVLHALSGSDVTVTAVIRQGGSGLDREANVHKVVQTSDLFRETEAWWAKVCQNIDIVVHLAWYTEPGKYLMSPENLNCLAGTLNLAKGAAKGGISRFVGTGTCFEYDLSAGMLSADTPLKPVTPYAGAKAAACMMLSQWLPLHQVGFAWCRLFYLYGKGEDARRLVPYLRFRLSAGKLVELTAGRQIRDFLDVEEAGRQIAEIVLGNRQGPVNICSGIPVTVRQLAEQIADEYGRRDLLRFGARPENLVDPPCVVGIRE